MKFNSKLAIVAMMLLVLFTVSAVSASENVTAPISAVDQVSQSDIVSHVEEVQSVETPSLEATASDNIQDVVAESTSDTQETQIDEYESSSDNPNTSNSNTISQKISEPVLKATNDEDVLGITITPAGRSFQDIRNAINAANDGDIIDLGGFTYTGSDGNIQTNKKITIQNGILDGIYANPGFAIVFSGANVKNVQFTNFNSQVANRLFTFSASTLENLKFTNCNHDTFRGIFTGFYGLNAINVTFDNIVSGTCVLDMNAANLTNGLFTNSRVTDSTHDEDTGQFTVMVNSIMDNCTFINTSSKQHSGAICMAKGKNTVINSNFINCTAWVGGAIYAHGDFITGNEKYTIENCKFINCSAEEEGGALGLSHNNMDIKNCIFINNTATKGAGIMVGGIYHPKGMDGDNSHGHNITVDYCYFENNKAREEGGAVHISGDDNTVYNSEFHYNEAPEGGAVYITGENASVIGSHFNDNFAHEGHGSAVFIEGENALINDSEFYEHDCDSGTVYIIGNHATVHDSTFANNNATHGGAAVFIDGNYTNINNILCINNTAHVHGGAVHTRGSHITIENSKFYENKAIPSEETQEVGLGGAIYIDGNNNHVGGSDFSLNTARNGSAIYNSGYDFTVENSYFNNNQAFSYLLFVEAINKTSYYSEDNRVNINVTHIGGDNIINAIHNEGDNGAIGFINVTYTSSCFGEKNTGDSLVHPVLGVEASDGGEKIYQDDREDLQIVDIVIVNNKTGAIVKQVNGRTGIYGNISTYLVGLRPGNYTVRASHPEDRLYKAIANQTNFEVLPHVDIKVTKTSDKEIYMVGEEIRFFITVSGVGTNATNVIVKDILPEPFTYVSDDPTQGYYDIVNNEWVVGFLPHGDYQTLTLVVTSSKTGTFNNVVNATCNEKDWNLSNNVANKTVKVTLDATKDVSNKNPSVGDIIEYYLRIYNHGDDLYNGSLVIRDKLPDGVRFTGDYTIRGADEVRFSDSVDQLIWTITNIEAGSHATITIKCEVIKDGEWNNTLIVPTDREINASIKVNSSADLQLIKSVSVPTVSKGDVVNWTITVINHGPSIAFGVWVDDLLPEGLSIAGHAIPSDNTRYDRLNGVWTIGTLGVEDYVTLIIPTRIDATGLHNITNVAVANSTTPDPTPENNKDNDTVYFNPDVSITKVVSTKNTKHNEIISWNITVTNNGPNDALNVYVIDKLPTNQLKYINYTAPNGQRYNAVTGRWDIGTLKEKESVSLIINSQVLVREGLISNNATVYASNDNDEDNNYADDFTVVETQADVGVVKLVSNQTSHYGDEIKWTIKVTNYGPSVAENVVLIDFLPINDLKQTKQPFVSKGQISHEGVTGRWDIGDMAVGETQYCEVYTKIATIDKTIINVVNVTSDTEDPNLSNNRAENGTYVPPECDVGVIKKVNILSPNIGDTVIWTITVVNHGPNVAKDVVVTDVLPAGLQYVSNTVPTIGSYSHNRNTWTIGDLDVDARHDLTITTLVTVSGQITNEVNITTSTYENNLDNNYDNETINVSNITDLEIIKEVSNKNPKKGDEITWTITVINHGPNTAENVYVNDTLPKGLVYQTDDSNGKYNPNTGIWEIGTLEKDGRRVLVITTLVNITNATITNVAVVNSTTPDNNESNNKDNNTTNVDPEADLEIIKLVSNKTAKFGDVITWTIIVTNNGPDAAKNVYVRDNFPSNDLILSGFTKTKGIFDSDSFVWFIPELAKGESQKLTIRTIVNVTNKTIINVVNVTSDAYDPNETNNEANNTTDVNPKANLVVVKEVSNKTVKFGDIITWTITVTNVGPDVAVNARVIDKLPAGLVYQSDDSNGKYDKDTGVWTVGDLAKGQSAKLVITTQVNTTDDTIENIANATSDTPGNNTPGNNTTNVDSNADLEVIKIVSNKTAKKGDIITWIIVVTNHGPSFAKDVYVVDELPAGLSYVSHKAEIGLYDNSNGIWYLGDLDNGDSFKLVINTTVSIDNGTITNVAVVNSSTPDNNTDNNEGNNTTDVNDNADLEVIKVVSNKNPHFGEIITWTITVTNHGPSEAKNVIVTDKLPAGLVFVSANGNYDVDTGVWTVGDLANTESKSLVITTLVNITNATIKNIANVTSDTPDSNKTNNEGNNTTDVDPESDLEVIKVVSNKNPKFGEIITWTITVTNHGPDNAVNVKVTDKLPAGLVFMSANGNYDKDSGVWTVGDLAKDESKSLVITTLVNITNTTIRNVANVTSDTYDPNKTNNEGNNTTDVDPLADLEIIKLVSNSTAHKGDVVTWTVIVKNNGPDAANNVYVSDLLPADLIYKSHSTTKGLFDSVKLLWFISSLANGESQSLTIDTIVNSTNTAITNIVNVTSDTPDSNESNNEANNTTNIPPEADIGVVKEVNATECVKDQIVEWTITMTNHGPDDAYDVIVKDNLPDTLIFISADGDYNPVTGIWTIDHLANGETRVLTIITKINTTGMVIVNNVTAASGVYDPDMSNNNATNSTTVVDKQTADLEVVKVVDNANPHKGDTVTWTITVTNNGPATAKDAIVTDSLPQGLEFVSADGNYDKDTGVWTIGDMANGETKTLVIKTIVTITNANITNIAVAESSTPDPNETNNKDNDTSKVDPEADVKVIKTVSNPNPMVGDTVTWTIFVINLGPDTAKDVVVEDKLPNGLTLISSKGTKGSYNNGIWTIGSLTNHESVSLVLTTKVTKSGDIENVVVATTSTYDPNITNNRDKEVTTPEIGEADLEIVKVADKSMFKVGDKVVWTITVTNYGPNKAINVVVEDWFIGDVKYISSSVSKGKYNPKGIWTIGELDVGETVVLKLVTQVLSGNYVLNNAVVVSSTPDPDLDNNRDDELVTIDEGDDGNRNTPEPQKGDSPNPTPKTSTPKMHAAGNPVVMVLLALLAIAGVSLRRKI